MIFTSSSHGASTAKIIDQHGEDICKTNLVRWYNIETKMACIVSATKNERGGWDLKPDGLGGWAYDIIHFPDSKLVLE